MRSLIFAIIFCAFLLPSRVYAGEFILFFFPMLKDQSSEQSSEKLEAPFADQEAMENASSDPDDTVPLELPHRSAHQIGDWLVTSVAESMSFGSEQQLLGARKYFDDNGWAEFRQFLIDKNIAKIFQSGRFNIESFVDGDPLAVNSGPVDGSYKWLIEVPLMVTYLDKGMRDYERSAGEPTTQMMAITVQVGRSKEAETENKVLIERWSGRVLKSSKKEL